VHFRLSGDCLLWAVYLKITEGTQTFFSVYLKIADGARMFFPREKALYLF
jgi:hypothetical protein